MRITPALLVTAALPLLVTVGCITKGADVDFGGGDEADTASGEDGEASSAPYGPDNSWYHVDESELPADLEGTGYGVGDIANNFTVIDQNGDAVELYQFYGQVIVLDVFTEW
jgi:cytochrome oxidase Cu insertion factor (SCO1/SenC/PrrC family)